MTDVQGVTDVQVVTGRRDLRSLLIALERAGPDATARVLDALSPSDIRAIEEEWTWQTLRGQREPEGDWRVWMIMAGRGFGKTRAGAEWVWARARAHPQARIALVGGSIEDAAKVMVEGDSGLMRVARTGETPKWRAGRSEILFPSGAVGFLYSGANPERLRGPQHDFAWCDELAKWRHPEATWTNLELGLRLGTRPRLIVTTTPAPVPVLHTVMASKGIIVTRGRTRDNLHLPDVFRAEMLAIHGGTRLGRQELDGEWLDDADGTLWPREMIELSRAQAPGPDDGFWQRIVVGVDPPATVAGKCGIVVAGLGADGVAYVLADLTVTGARPDGWAQAVARAAQAWGADRVVAERNNGGDMVESVLRGAAPGLPVKPVSASRGKIARAEPVASAFERGDAKLAGCFPDLEDELNGMTGGGYRGGQASPDRADAMVWALSELIVTSKSEPRVLAL